VSAGDLLEQALELVRAGCSVVPAYRDGGGGKRSYVPWTRWQTERPGEAQVIAWAQEFRPKYWATVTGKVSNRLVLDYDRDEGLKLLADHGLDPVRRTGKPGAHVEVAWPGFGVSNAQPLAPFAGLDLRGDGGLAFVLGPDRQTVSTRVYTLDELPDELREAIEARRHRPPAAPVPLPEGHVAEGAERWLRKALQRVEDGEDARNGTGFWLACQLRDEGYTIEEAEPWMVDFAQRVAWHGDHEYTADEALRSLASAYSRERRDPAAKGATQAAGPPGAEGDRSQPSLLRVVRASTLPVVAMRYVRAPYLPRKLTGLEGRAKTGKSTITADQAAAVTTGRGWPDPGGQGGPAGNVLILSAEDDASDTIVPRLEEAVADLDRVLLFGRHPASEDSGRLILADASGAARTLVLPADLQRLADTIEHHRIDLVVLDPLFAFLGQEVKTNIDSLMRSLVLAPLGDIAAHLDACIQCLRHWTKASTGNVDPLELGGGSIGITGAYRSLLSVAEVDEARVFPFAFAGHGGLTDDDVEAARRDGVTLQGPYVLASAAANALARSSTPSWAYYLTGRPDQPGRSRIRWQGTTALSAADIARTPDRRLESPALDEAVGFLSSLLRAGPVAAGVVKDKATRAGISERTLKRAKAELGVIVEEVRNERGKVSGWVWRLP
jgi:hypothetical protein